MVNSNANALGIIFPNSYDGLVPELVTERLMASIPFAGRYRMVDFILSSMVNCGIDNVSLIVRKNYHSLMDHLGSGREWDLTRKYGGLNIVPPFASNTVKVYNGRIEALASILDMLKDAREKYVVMSDANLAVNFDFTAMLEQHIESGADVTIAYKKQEIPVGMKKPFDITKDLYYTFELDDDGRIRQLRINPEDEGVQNLSMNIYIIEREFLVHMISEAYSKGMVYFDRDLLAPNLERLNVRGFEFNGYLARISDIKSYFNENMKLLKDENLDGLFYKLPSALNCSGHTFCIVFLQIQEQNSDRNGNANCASCEAGIPIYDIFLGQHRVQTDRNRIISRIRTCNYLCEDEIQPGSHEGSHDRAYNDRFRQRHNDLGKDIPFRCAVHDCSFIQCLRNRIKEALGYVKAQPRTAGIYHNQRQEDHGTLGQSKAL